MLVLNRLDRRLRSLQQTTKIQTSNILIISQSQLTFGLLRIFSELESAGKEFKRIF